MFCSFLRVGCCTRVRCAVAAGASSRTVARVALVCSEACVGSAAGSSLSSSMGLTIAPAIVLRTCTAPRDSLTPQVYPIIDNIDSGGSHRVPVLAKYCEPPPALRRIFSRRTSATDLRPQYRQSPSTALMAMRTSTCCFAPSSNFPECRAYSVALAVFLP